MSARPEMPVVDDTVGLERLLNPRSIAIIGASSNAESINGQPLRNLIARGFAGPLYPVNPKYPEIAGLPCYASAELLPEAPDLALVLLGAARAVQAIEECGRRGIPFAIVIGAGFAELGPEGERLQQELVEAAARTGMRLVGPNCIGMMNLPDDVFAGFGPVFGLSGLRTGPVSMVTQSGGFGFSVVNMAEELGLGFRYVVSTGNEADLTSIDLLETIVEDPKTRVIAAYFEGIKDAWRVPGISRRALELGKPIIVWKVGNSPEGARAAASHTGNLGGAAELYQAAFDQFGWIRIDDVHELVDYAAAFERGKLPANGRVGIVTVSGGAGVLLADACAQLGLEVPPLAAGTRARLAKVLPAYASTENPVDVTASILDRPRLLRSALEIILDDPGIGSLLVVASSVEGAMAEGIAAELASLDAATDKPLLVSWSSREARVGNAYRALREARVPLYRTPSRCARSLGALSRFADAMRRHERDTAEIDAPAAESLVVDVGALTTEFGAKRLLAAYGLQPTREQLVTDAPEARRVAAEIGFPVALKVQSPDIPHKTEAGGVRLGLGDDAAVAAAYGEISATARARVPGARIEGLLVQEMVNDGIEVILGVVNDARFGPAVMFGLGGIFTEALNDVVFRFAPVGPSAARDMVDAIRGRALLYGARGRPPSDVDALVQAIVDVSRLVMAHSESVAELDINPLVVMPRGQGVRVVDALIRGHAVPLQDPLAIPGGDKT